MNSNSIKEFYDAEPKSPLYVAINRGLVKNDPNLMSMMKQASSKMCLTTALTPGFKGFDLMKQLGACPMGMRWGASTDMGMDISHIWIDQITYWDSVEAHELFHETFEDVVVTVMATHRVRPGKEAEFEEGEIATMNLLKESPGMIGFQILKRIGVSTLGSGHATVESMLEDLKDSSGSKLKRTAEVWEGYTLPAEYLVMVEWESLKHAQRNMPHVNVKPELLYIHGSKVLDNCLYMPNVRISDSMFREQTNREVLNGLKS